MGTNPSWSVGDGSQIFIKKDPWLAHTESGVISTSLGADFDNVRVQSLMIPGSIQWDWELIAVCLTQGIRS